MQDSFSSALFLLEESITHTLQKIPENLKANVQEIRLRAGRPLSLNIGGEIFFIDKEGGVFKDYKTAILINPFHLKETLKKITGNSLYSHEKEILNGFISMPMGNRAGVCGTVREGKFSFVSSINIRIAHECIGVASREINNYSGGSVLICGPPASGKTTFLRDLIRGISNGESGRYYKISLIDTRGEIASSFGGSPSQDIGINTDVFSGSEKHSGIEAALRSMSPEIIAFDEIGNAEDLLAVERALYSGAYIFTTAHLNSPEDLTKREIISPLLKRKAFVRVIFLKSPLEKPIIIGEQNYAFS